MLNNQLKRLEETIQAIKDEIGKLGALRPGSLSKQARKSKTTYGAYWHLSYTHRGKGHTEYVRDAFVSQVKAESIIIPGCNANTCSDVMFERSA